MNARLFLLLVFAAALAQAQPQIRHGGVVNAASYFAVASGSNPISPGSFFVIFGSGLGPANIAIGSLPFSTQLPDANGTSVRFSGNGKNYDAFMYYAVGNQISGIVPSSVPPGGYNVTVTYNGKTSNPENIVVVKANPGIFTRNQAGSGLVKAQVYRTSTDYFEPTLTAPAAPGQTVVLYGTGLGAVNAPDNDAPGAVQVTDPVTVYINGSAVQPFYAGRSPQYPGLDQIDFVLPADLVPGCYTDVIVGVAGASSNVVAIPTAAAGAAACTHPFGLTAASLAKLDNGGTVNVGALLLLPGITMDKSTTPNDIALAAFFNANADQLFLATKQLQDPNQPPEPVAAGKCAVWDVFGPSTPGSNLDVATWGAEIAPSTISLSAPGGKTLALVPAKDLGAGGGYASLGAAGTFAAGTYTLQANLGGNGSVSAPMTLPTPLSWTAPPADNSPVTRSAISASWTGGGTIVTIGGQSSGNNTGKRFACGFNGADGKGTAPAAVGNQLPANAAPDPNGSNQMALLSSGYGTIAPVGKLDGGMTVWGSGSAHSVVWK